MKKATSTKELYISANWLSGIIGINRKLINYYAVKLRLRFFKFGGVRFLEKSDAICLATELNRKKNFGDLSVILDAIEEYHS